MIEYSCLCSFLLIIRFVYLLSNIAQFPTNDQKLHFFVSQKINMIKVIKRVIGNEKFHFRTPSTKSEIALDNRQKKMPQDIQQGRMVNEGAGGCAQQQRYINKGYKKVVLKQTLRLLLNYSLNRNASTRIIFPEPRKILEKKLV